MKSSTANNNLINDDFLLNNALFATIIDNVYLIF